MTMMEPVWDPVKSENTPIRGGTNAPPNTPVIIRPEISSAFSGRYLSACEYMTEKILRMHIQQHQAIS